MENYYSSSSYCDETIEESRNLFKKSHKSSYFNIFKKMLYNYGIRPLFDKNVYAMPNGSFEYQFINIDSGKTFSTRTLVKEEIIAAKRMAK